MLKPSSKSLQLIRCSTAANGVFSFRAANCLSNLGILCTVCRAECKARVVGLMWRGHSCPRMPAARFQDGMVWFSHFADKNVRATRAKYTHNHRPCDGSDLVAVSTSTCNFSTGSTPGG